MLSFFTFSTVNANNIQISNVGITGQNIAQHYSFVKFDLSWENSWRISVGPSNWDAAWVFIKFRVNNGDWQHARLNYANGTTDGHLAPAGSSIITANDGLSYGLGTFIHRSADGSGNVNWQNVQLRWNYGLNAVGDNDLVDVQVFAIEMVYVHAGAFNLGGASGTEEAKFYRSPSTTTFYNVVSEAAITIGTGTGNLYYGLSATSPGDQAGPIPALFPKGYQAFYCMKYEVSEDQWVSFFNTLTDTQKATRNISSWNGNGTLARSRVSWPGTGIATTSAPDRAVSFTSWNDATAYLDWAALRPMTELEFEKAGRGPLTAVADGYAWGTNNVFGSAYTLINDGTSNELISNPGESTGNAIYKLTRINGQGGAVRNGIFAASAPNKNREETGGSYYGIMELSGNVWEFAVTVGTSVNRAFTGLHGNGALSVSGNNNETGWPIEGGFRGGSSASDAIEIALSARRLASYMVSNGHFQDAGFRAVRTAN